MDDTKNLLSIGKAAEYLNISIDTLRRWEKKGKVESFRSPGNHRYFIKEDLDKLFGKKYEHDAPRKRSVKKDVSEAPVEHKPAVVTSKKPQEDVYKTALTSTPTTETRPAPTPLMQERILDRPTREVKIPEIEIIKVIQRDKVEISQNGVQETRTKEVETSILTPSNVEDVPIKESVAENIDPEPTPSKKKEKVKNKPKIKNKLFLYAVITVTILIAIAAIFFFIGLSSQPMLSPVP